MTATSATALHRALSYLNDAGQRVPCQSILSENWTSDRDVERAAAIESCAYCPLLALCREHAIEADERFHIWGGLDFAEQSKSRASANRAAQRNSKGNRA